ncbi:hypothetical protein GCK72_012126 [Caenorhabditis remanei]|uniref:BTB domain-containing protein n=1 Tax=Caenorhabditis remanei TaxID=31234 RepID=A0A6A5GM11_CAERE|nr:hypothetical protein GCK72_012126 [Caenorhabditis remanei]KAF1755676.1 hypothetical protein GCK72_012126 [Caenorhabditis remanei]
MDARQSYLEDYPNPLGHFKSISNIENISSIVANRHQEKRIIDRGFVKMNIYFTHGIWMPDAMGDRLYLAVYCGVLCPEVKDWRIKANVKFVLHNLNDEQNSVEYDYGDVWFDNYNHEMPVIYQDTNISLDSLLDENFGYVKDNMMRVGTDIRVLEVEGFHQPTVVNYRVPPVDPFYKQLCKFSDAEIYINKTVMNTHWILRPYNRPIRDFLDLEIPKPSTGTLEEFLDCAYGYPIQMDTRAGIRDILRSAKFFKMRSVAQRAAQTIIHDLKYPKGLKQVINLGIEFSMRRVVHAWLNRMESISKKDLEDLNIEKMSGETMKAIVKRVFEM